MANHVENNSMLNLTRGGLLAKNTMLNILFQGVPLLVALITIPVLIKGLGTDRFGVLSIAWIVMGYFSLFDFGIARVLIKMIGEKLAVDKYDEIPALFWTGFTFLSILGLVMAVVLIFLSHTLVYQVFKIPPDLLGESVIAFWAISGCIPVVITTAALWGVMEANQSFLKVNIVRTLNTLFTLLIPVLGLLFTNHIGYIIIMLTIGRIVLWFVSLYVALDVLDVLKRGYIFSRELVKPILKLGGWMSVSNIISPLMVYSDRFLIGALLSVTAVTYYVTPYEVVTKILMVAIALNRVLFPAFSASYDLDRTRAARIYEWGRKLLWVFMFPIILLIVLFAKEGLQIWVGNDLATQSTLVMQLLALGVFLNAPAQVSLSLIQAAGRPDITAKLHLIETPLYFLMFVFMVDKMGINGAALTWSARVLLDSVLMHYFAGKLLDMKQLKFFIGLAFAMIVFIAAMVIQSTLIAKLFFVAVMIPVLLLFVFKWWFEKAELKQVLQFRRN